MSSAHLLAYIAAVVVVIAIPGPSVLFTISRALTVGRQAAIFTVIGNAAGCCLQVAAISFGLGALLAKAAVVVTILKLAGAVYLVILGIQAIRHRHAMAEALAANVPPVRPVRAIRDGALVGSTNAKTTVFFVVALPEVVGPGGGLPVPLQMLIIGAMFPAIALLLDSIWAIAAGTVREWFARSPRRMAAIGGAGGMVMIGLGIGAAATGRHD
jgi:threonine/homoserine/homoserine lactone efflux protein